MREQLSLDHLFPLQRELDERIALRHGSSYEKTMRERLLAFLVELGEFANETRCFKFWSLKGPSPKERILEEYADGLHFLLSLGAGMGVEGYTHSFREEDRSLVEQILLCYALAGDLVEEGEEMDPRKYALLFSAYLNLLPILGYEFAEAEESYMRKREENFKRQEEGY